MLLAVSFLLLEVSLLLLASSNRELDAEEGEVTARIIAVEDRITTILQQPFGADGLGRKKVWCVFFLAPSLGLHPEPALSRIGDLPTHPRRKPPGGHGLEYVYVYIVYWN